MTYLYMYNKSFKYIALCFLQTSGEDPQIKHVLKFA